MSFAPSFCTCVCFFADTFLWFALLCWILQKLFIYRLECRFHVEAWVYCVSGAMARQVQLITCELFMLTPFSAGFFHD